MVDGDCRGLDVDHPPAVGGEHGIVGGGSEVDRLVDLVGDVDVAAGRVARVVGRDELVVAQAAAAPAASAQRAEAADLDAQRERSSSAVQQPAGRGERSDGHLHPPRGYVIAAGSREPSMA